MAVFFASGVTAAAAQNKAVNEEPKVLFGGDKVSISGFGGPLIEFSSIGGDASIMNGGGGAVLFNRQVYLGGYGLNLTNDLDRETDGVNRRLEFSHGGLYMGYLIQPYKLVHFGVGSRLGWGTLRLTPDDAFLPAVAPISDNVLVWTPQAEIQVNLSYWFRVNAGLGYRVVNGVENSIYGKDDLSSPLLTLSFLFGWFK